MVTTLEKHGDKYALILDRAMMEQLNIDPETPLKITPNCNSFTVERASETEDEEDEALFLKAMDESHRDYGEVFKKLAE
jgi:antitoxin component of MazEF toxin-antitoxin module